MDREKELERLEIEYKQLENAKIIMSTKEGRKFIDYLLEKVQMYGTSMSGNSWTFYNEGRRSVGLEIVEIILKACPELYIEMLKERQINAEPYIETLRKQIEGGIHDGRNQDQ